MSRENVEIAKRLSAAMNRLVEIDAVLDLIADDLVVTNLAGPLDEPRTFHGREALIAFWGDYTEVLDDFRREVSEWIDADDWVIVVESWKGRGKTSRAEVEASGANAGRFQDGKLVEFIIGFATKEAALEAVGLRE